MTTLDWLQLLANLLFAAAGGYLTWRALRHSELPAAEPGWTLDPPQMDRHTLKTVLVPPHLMLGEERMTARVFLPVEEQDARQMQRHPGALMLSAAAALTADRVAGSRDWLSYLRIDVDNFTRKHPRMDELRVDGQQGVLVLDGLAPRGFFVGGPQLAEKCTHFADGETRRIGRADRALIEQLPPDALYYATCTVEQNRVGALTFIGAIQPLLERLPAEDFRTSFEQLRKSGIATAFLPCDASTAQAAEAVWGGALPFAPADVPGTMAVRPAVDSAAVDYASPVFAMLNHQRTLRVRRLRGAAVIIALALTALFSGSFFLCTGLCYAVLMLRLAIGSHDTLDHPATFSLRGLLLALIPCGAVPLAAGLICRLAATSPVAMAFGSGMTLGLTVMCLICWLMPDEGERGSQAWMPLLCALLALILSLLFGWLPALGGLGVGLMAGFALARCLSMTDRGEEVA